MNCDNEVAVRSIITDYERRLAEMEKLHNNKNEDLQKIIEKL